MQQISEGYKPYKQHVILSALLMLGFATGIFALAWVGYLIYYSFSVAKLVGWKNYWKIDWMLPVGLTWNFGVFISGALALGAESLTITTGLLGLFCALLGLAIVAWGLGVIISAFRRGTLNHYAFLAGADKSSFIATSEVKRFFNPDTSSK